jgi:hypothetical protein
MLLVMLHQDAGMAPNLDAPLQVSGQPIAHRFVILAPAQSSTLPDTGVAYANVGWLGWFAWLLLAFGWMITKRINKAAVPLLALATEGAWATPVTRGRFLTAPDGACYGLTDTRDPSAHFAFARRYKRPAATAA